MSSQDKFVSLHNHTSSGSLLDALIRTDELVQRAKSLGQSAVAITDHGSIFSVYDAYKSGKKHGIKVIPGNEFYFVHDLEDSTEKRKHIVLLAQNEVGWKNILKLNYLSWTQQRTVFTKQYPMISWKDIEKYHEGIVCLTACASGILSKHVMNNDFGSLERDFFRLKNIFQERLFLEIQPHKLKTEDGVIDQEKINFELYKLAKEANVKVTATCDTHYLDATDAIYHDMLLAIKDKKALSDPDRHRYGVTDLYLKGTNDMLKFFGLAIGDEVVNNSKFISDLCQEPTYLAPGKPRLPSFPVEDAKDYPQFTTWKEKQKGKVKELPEDALYLRYKTNEGFNSFIKGIDKERAKEYWDRLVSELKVIEDKNFSSYMLIVADYLAEAKAQNNPTGPARGSAAGSLVSYLTGITKVDPIKHNLLFARFLNKYKKDFPDIDSDIANPEQLKVYVKNKYGDKRVAGISNEMIMTTKVVVKDVIRSLELGGTKSTAFEIANEITKHIPDDAESIDDAVKNSPEVAKILRQYPEVLPYCRRLENLERQQGVHAAGVVIADADIDGIAPLRQDKEGNPIMMWEKKRVEENGFIKMDFLGLTTLNIMAESFRLIKQTHNLDVSMENIPTDDAEVFKMISKGDVKGVFQLEATLAPLCKAIKPKTIDDLAVINALGRPAVSQKQRQDYIDARFGRKKVDLIDQRMENCVKDTYGELLFEEQLMVLAHDIAGWELDKADSLRKITKLKEKGKELLEKTEVEFLTDSVKNGIEYEKATEIFNIVKSWGGYGFNKSHAVSYSYISYYTAWLKHHYPTEFMCAVLNSEDPNSDKVQEYRSLATEMGIVITPPSVQDSETKYQVLGDKKIVTGLSAIRGVKDKASNFILKKKPYKTFLEFLTKMVGNKEERSPVNKTAIESLIKAGCFDGFKVTRKNAYDNWSEIRDKIVAAKKKDALILEWPFEHPEEEWDKKELLTYEKEALGCYISGNANDIFPGFFKSTPDILKFSNLQSLASSTRTNVEAVIKSKLLEKKIQKKGRNAGKTFAKFLLEDVSGKTAEMTVWPDIYSIYRDSLQEGLPIKAMCDVNDYMGMKNLVLNRVETIPGKVIFGQIIKGSK